MLPHNIQSVVSQSPPRSPIKQFPIGRLLDENMFERMTPIPPQVDSASLEIPTVDGIEEEPEPFPGFMVN